MNKVVARLINNDLKRLERYENALMAIAKMVEREGSISAVAKELAIAALDRTNDNESKPKTNPILERGMPPWKL